MMVTIGLILILMGWMVQIAAPMKKKELSVQPYFPLLYGAGALVLGIVGIPSQDYLNVFLSGLCGAMAIVIWLRVRK